MPRDARPVVFIVSDSIGDTAEVVVNAVMAQFEPETFRTVRLTKIASREQVVDIVGEGCRERCVFFYTFANPELRDEMVRQTDLKSVFALDILGPGVDALSEVARVEPKWQVGMMRKTDRGYFDRIEALEFAVAHDDGRGAEELHEAEVVLIGVSRSSKTPLSMYLAFKGYRVANVPLVLEVEPPPQLFELDSRRVFGLTSEAETLVEIRARRFGDLGAWARRYAERERVESELEAARAVMKRIGCVVVKTTNRAIEETAQEIIRYLE